MATKKPATNKKIIDVNKPGAVGPDASSRPVIVSHKPMIEDPMVAKQAAQPPSAPTLARKGKTLQPLSDTTNDKKDVSKKTTTTTKPAVEPEATAAKPADEPKTAEAVETKSTVKDTTPVSKPAQPSSPTKQEASEDPVVASVPASTDPDTKTAVPATSVPADKTEETPEQAASADAAAGRRKAEADAAEQARLDKYEKMIEQKTYFAPVDQSVSSSRAGKTLITILIVLVLIAIGGALAIDAGLVETDITVPFDLIQN